MNLNSNSFNLDTFCKSPLLVYYSKCSNSSLTTAIPAHTPSSTHPTARILVADTLRHTVEIVRIHAVMDELIEPEA